MIDNILATNTWKRFSSSPPPSQPKKKKNSEQLLGMYIQRIFNNSKSYSLVYLRRNPT